MTKEGVKIYKPEEDEDVMTFMRRVINAQPDREPLHIVEQLVEIAMGELKERPCQVSAETSPKYMTVSLRHGGKPIDERMVWLMGDHTDRVDYHPDESDDTWVLTIQRVVPPMFVTRR
jgi:hypothetical protein